MLYHFSEDPSIEVFEPHVAATAQVSGAFVWAIDAEHEQLYWYPRQCPRIAFWPSERTPVEARAWFESQTSAPRVHAAELAWFERIKNAVLYRYALDADSFEPMDANAGHWVSRAAVRPRAIERLDDLLALHASSGDELRFVPGFWPLWDYVVASGLEFSGTRLTKATRV